MRRCLGKYTWRSLIEPPRGAIAWSQRRWQALVDVARSRSSHRLHLVFVDTPYIGKRVQQKIHESPMTLSDPLREPLLQKLLCCLCPSSLRASSFVGS